MTLDEALSSIHSEGFRLGSLCELAEADWYACLISEETFVHKGSGPTPVSALLVAAKVPPSGRLISAKSVQTFDLSDLGLTRPPPRFILGAPRD